MRGPHGDRHAAAVQTAVEGGNEVHPCEDTRSERVSAGVESDEWHLVPRKAKQTIGSQSHTTWIKPRLLQTDLVLRQGT